MRTNFRNLFCPLLLLSAVLLSVSSCRVVKHLPDGQSLLVQNKFVVINNKLEKKRISEDLSRIAAQKPNHRFLQVFPIKMWIYYKAQRAGEKKLTKFNQWLMDKVGEAPVVFDSTQLPKSADYMNNYLFNIGYFHSVVRDTVITKKKRTKIIYTVDPGVLWKISEVELPKGHTILDSLVRESHKHSFLHSGDRFDINNVKNERDRIETVLRNSGFYYFNREYVSFNYDTTGGANTLKVAIRLNPNAFDTIVNKQYRVNSIYIYADYDAETLGDTLKRDTIKEDEFRFIAAQMKVRKQVLRDAVFFRRGELYNKDAETATLRRLSQLGVFKFISLEFKKTSDDTLDNYLDCIIQLTPAQRYSHSETADANVTTEGLFGVDGTISYKDKNLTNSADPLQIDVSGGVQLEFAKAQKAQIVTGDLNANVTYYLNKFLIPFHKKLDVRHANPKTRFSLGYGFEHRFDFDTTGRTVFLYQLDDISLSYGYEWSPNPRYHHLLNPINISFFLLPKTGEAFIQRLDSIPILKSSYEEQIIIGPSYIFTYTNQKGANDKTYMYLKTNLETAGNLLEGVFKLATLGEQHDSLYNIVTRPFSEYVREEIDWRNYFRINRHSMFVVRTYEGVGVAYGNSLALPFTKQFYVGGPNSLRGFQIREIGPGGYVDTSIYNRETGSRVVNTFFDQTGDIKLEANAELRFDIYHWLKGALFSDAGNIWTVRKDSRFLGNFDFTRFWSEFAVDAGAGIRLDFDFFVIRLDYGFPLRDPRRVPGKRWQFEDWYAFKNGVLQLAIGYPF